MKVKYKNLKYRYSVARRVVVDEHFPDTAKLSSAELEKSPKRYDIINFLLSTLGSKTTNYLEIGVRKPAENFDLINANNKYGVDPGVEFEENPVEFKCTSDEFFEKLSKGEILTKNTRFDIIFIDGLHTADQADRDIVNSLAFLSDNGFIVMHDCNPPSEFHAREKYNFWSSPAMDHWNGTTWKAFAMHRLRTDIYSCCVDTDWGIGIISRQVNLGPPSTIINPFYEYSILDRHRKESLNLISFEELKAKVFSK